MIVFQCDICKRQYKDYKSIDTIVFFRQKIDYCVKCAKVIDKMREELQKEMNYRNVRLEQFEEKLIKKYTRRTQKI